MTVNNEVFIPIIKKPNLKQEIAESENKFQQIIKRQANKNSEEKAEIAVPDKKEELINENEEYMNLKHVAYFHKILSDWKTQLSEGIKKTILQMQNDSVSFSDPTDKATQEEEFSLELHARGRDHKAIRDIERALERLKHNDYGYCDACGIEIGLKRLQASPTANLCIDCKTVEETIKKTSVY